MNQEFLQKRNVHVNRDDKGIVRDLLHNDEPVVVDAPTAQLAAADYLSQYGDLLGIKPAETNNLGQAVEKSATDAAGELRFHSEKQQFDMTTVAYQQTHFGLPVWHGGVTIQMKQGPYRVVSSQSTRHADLDVKQPAKAKLASLLKLKKNTLAKLLGLSDKQKVFDQKTLKIDSVEPIIYRYKKARRIMANSPQPEGSGGFAHTPPQLPLPAVAKSIAEEHHYVSGEV